MLPIVVRRNAGQIQRRIPQFFRAARRFRRVAPYTVPPAVAAAGSYAFRAMGRRGANTRTPSSGSGMQLQSGFNPSSVGGRKRLGMYKRRYGKRTKYAKRKRRFAQKVYAIANNTGQKCDVKKMEARYMGSAINNCGYYEYSFLKKADIETSYSKTKRMIQDPTTGNAVTEVPTMSVQEALKTKYMKGFQFTTLRNNDPSKASAKLQITWYRCIEDTDDAPVTLWIDDINHRDAGATTTLATLQSPLYNIRQPVQGGRLYKHWKQFKQANYELTGGDACTIAMRRKTPFNHTASENLLQYRKGVSQVACVRWIGNIVHDQTDASQVGYAAVTLDTITHSEDTWNVDTIADKKHHMFKVNDDTTLGTVVAEEAVVEDNAVMT